MKEYYPLLILGAIIGVFTAIFVFAYVFMKDKKEAIGFDRNMKDSEIIKRLLVYAKPYTKSFIVVFLLMLFSIAHEIISPLIMGQVIETIGAADGFELSYLISAIILYAVILIVSLICTYLQSIILQDRKSVV